MTDSHLSGDCLERIEEIALITQSNALSVEALWLRQEAREIQLRSFIANFVPILTQTAEEQEQEYAELQQRQAEADERFQVLFVEARADRTEMCQ